MKPKKFRPAVFIVVYKRTEEGIKYLLLRRKLHWRGWEFPKGKIENKERKEKTARREAWEESGLRVIKLKKFNISGRYLYPRVLPDRPDYIGQTYNLFAGEVKNENKKVRLDKREHSDFRWDGFEKAVRLLKWPNQKKCLKMVNNYLNKSLR